MNRGLIAPTAIVGGATLLILQQLWLADSGWSLLSSISRFVSTLILVATPPEPVRRSFLDYLTWPTALLGGLILISRYFLACATQSMRQATPKIDP